ncbi:MAG: hypothetical protein GXP62_13120 [Oligoflexia bacterium]|nr:hypothetical protein [Oligoflexia bacterium]
MNETATEASPWRLTTPPGTSDYLAWFEPESVPPTVRIQVKKTWLRYHLQAVDDLYKMLVAHGGWLPLGSCEEGNDPKPDTVEAWGRSSENPMGGWYGLRRGYRGRFANYIAPILKMQDRVEFEQRAGSWWVRAI